jgi:hypothetical protein
MAETSDHLVHAPPCEPDEPHCDYSCPVRLSGDTDRNAREDTELARLRRNYSRASSYRPQGSSTTSKRPTTLLERFTYSVSKSWRHQISITVEHSTCRDHLGVFLRACISRSCPSDTVESAICVLFDWGPRKSGPDCFTTSFLQSSVHQTSAKTLF